MNFPQEAIDQYLARRKEDIDNCRIALVGGNMDLIEEIAHKFKSNGLSYGIAEISTLGEALELAAKNRDTKAVDEFIQAIDEFIAKNCTVH
jgi:HPt (histidine-containing phosphotransfer) domain-containing protein